MTPDGAESDRDYLDEEMGRLGQKDLSDLWSGGASEPTFAAACSARRSMKWPAGSSRLVRQTAISARAATTSAGAFGAPAS